jgi:hypothetical protein
MGTQGFEETPTEVEVVKPQALDHSKRELKTKLNELTHRMLYIFKGTVISLPP